MSLCSIWALVALLPGGNTGSFRAIARYGQYALLAPAMCSGVPPLCAYAYATAAMCSGVPPLRAYAAFSPYCLAAIRALVALLPATGNTRFWLRLCARAGALARIRRLFRPPAGRAPVLAHSKEKFFIFYRVQSRVKLYMHAVGA